LNHQNNDVDRLSIDDNAAKSFNILAPSLNIYNYFDDLAKFLDYFSKIVLPVYL